MSKCTECRKQLAGRGDTSVVLSGPVPFVVCRTGPCARIFRARLLASRSAPANPDAAETAATPGRPLSWG